jgi:flagellar protein FlgJ
MRPAAVTDFSQFAGLRAEARGQSPEALGKTAKQFEALMLQQMLKSMRAASGGEDVMGSQQTSFYQDMFDQQLASSLAAGKGIGIADVLVKQLRMSESLGSVNAAADAVPSPVSGRGWPAGSGEGAVKLAGFTEALSPTPLPQVAEGQAKDFRPQSPQEFIEALLPHAEKAAKELGIPARVLVAQAALETGWGKHQIRNADGSSSYNLFGIKANAGWSGDRVTTQTTEFEGGRFEKQSASFRAYGSIAEAFDDYAHFLKSNPRYGDALRHQGSAHQFVNGLQKAGYATDPGYASKILRIADGNRMQLAMADLAGNGRVTA